MLDALAAVFLGKPLLVACGTEYLPKVECSFTVPSYTFPKHIRSMDTITAVDSDIAPVKCRIVYWASSKPVTHIHAFSMVRYRPRLDVRGIEQTTLNGKGVWLKAAKDARLSTILQYF